MKVFGTAQNFSAMIAYITKDEGRPHYQVITHNITPTEMSDGRREHQALLTSFDDNKKIITLKNLVSECYKFNMRTMFPAVVPFAYCVLFMLQSATYVLAPEFINSFKKVCNFV